MGNKPNICCLGEKHESLVLRKNSSILKNPEYKRVIDNYNERNIGKIDENLENMSSDACDSLTIKKKPLNSLHNTRYMRNTSENSTSGWTHFERDIEKLEDNSTKMTTTSCEHGDLKLNVSLKIEEEFEKSMRNSKHKIEILEKNHSFYDGKTENFQKALGDKYLKMGEEQINKVVSLNLASYEGYDKILEDSKSAHNLSIHIKSYLNEKNARINIFRSQWYVPCSAKEYIYFMRNIDEQNTVDQNIDKFFSFDKFSEDCLLIYLLYKKVIIADPRDFCYLKSIKKINESQGKETWCDSSTSIEDERYPEYKGKVRGNILISGQMVEDCQDAETTSERRALVRAYSEVDFKISLPVFLTRISAITEVKKYVEKCILKLKAKKQQSDI